jgi:shikimate kinase
MPGSGKSTTGVILAKLLAFDFVDTDVLIQTRQQKTLQTILDSTDHLTLRKIEEEEILRLDLTHHVIATGGSAVYSKQGMAHLQRVSMIVFLKADYETLQWRIDNFETRGIAKAADQTFRDLYLERQCLYERYAEMTLACDRIRQERAASLIAAGYRDAG